MLNCVIRSIHANTRCFMFSFYRDNWVRRFGNFWIPVHLFIIQARTSLRFFFISVSKTTVLEIIHKNMQSSDVQYFSTLIVHLFPIFSINFIHIQYLHRDTVGLNLLKTNFISKVPIFAAYQPSPLGIFSDFLWSSCIYLYADN